MEKKKRTLLILYDFFLPAIKAGGPVTSLSNLIHELGDGFQIFLVASDRDLGDKKAFQDIDLNVWLQMDGCKVMYLSPENQSVQRFRHIFREVDFDVLYLNSMFSPSFTLKPLLACRGLNPNKKVILAPRGMLGSGALKIKGFKKQVFLSLARIFRFFKGIEWHATGIPEKEEIEKNFGRREKIHVLSNIPSFAEKKAERRKDAGALNLLFYSRISEKKNLVHSLSLLKNLKEEKIQLNIYGPKEDEKYWQECAALIESLESNIRVHDGGLVMPENLSEVLAHNHVLILPTKHENYGHVIAECMSSGMPVLLSDNTPWTSLDKKKAGFDLPLQDAQGWLKAIQTFYSMDQQEYEIWSASARQFAEERMYDKNLISQYITLFS